MFAFAWRSSRLLLVLPLVVVTTFAGSLPGMPVRAESPGDGPVDFVVENLDGSQFIYVVFHALDRDGFCQPPDPAVSLHPVINQPTDFIIEAGDGLIVATSDGPGAFSRSANDVRTFSTAVNAASGSPVRAFPPLVDSVTDECQAWIKVAQSIPGPLRVLVTVPGDDGNPVAFMADLTRPAETTLSLNFRWSLVTWTGADGITPGAALRGPSGATDVTGQVSAVYGWDATAQHWAGYFPAGAGVPGANDLISLSTGSAYWVAITSPAGVTWQIR